MHCVEMQNNRILKRKNTQKAKWTIIDQIPNWLFVSSSLFPGTGWRPTLSSGMACRTWLMTFLPCTSVTTIASASKGTRTTRATRFGPSARSSAESSCWYCITSPCSPFCFLSHWWAKRLERPFERQLSRGGVAVNFFLSSRRRKKHFFELWDHPFSSSRKTEEELVLSSNLRHSSTCGPKRNIQFHAVFEGATWSFGTRLLLTQRFSRKLKRSLVSRRFLLQAAFSLSKATFNDNNSLCSSRNIYFKFGLAGLKYLMIYFKTRWERSCHWQCEANDCTVSQLFHPNLRDDFITVSTHFLINLSR